MHNCEVQMSTDHDHLDTIVHNYWEDIVNTVGAEHVIPNLRRVINAEEAEEVQNQSRFPTRRSRTNYLLDLLEKRSDGWIHFVIALRNLYPSLYTKIVDDYVKVFTRQQTGHVLEDQPANPGEKRALIVLTCNKVSREEAGPAVYMQTVSYLS